MSPFMSGVSSPHLSDTRRSTPVLPPGLPLPFGRAPASQLEKEQANLPAMPELGRIPPSQVVKQEPLPITKPEMERPSSKSGPPAPLTAKTVVERDAQADLAFPALPKATPAPVLSVGKTRKAKADPKTSTSTVTAESVAEKPIPAMSNNVQSVDTKPSDGQQTSSKSAPNHPGKLDISAAQNIKHDTPPTDTPGTATMSASVSGLREQSPAPLTSSRPGTPSLGDAAVKRIAQPRTLRIVGTPKTEVPPSATSPATVATTTAVRPSRQASVASAIGPGTPLSENNNDTLSITDSMSRANSPPPASSRVGSAPVRTKTKSQQKKERQERAKVLEDIEKEEADPSSPAEVVVQEPILGRKKKSKAKKAPAVAKAVTTNPVVSRPVSPPAALPEAAQVVEAIPAAAPSPKPVEKAEDPPQQIPDDITSKVEDVPTPTTETDASKRSFLSDLVTSIESAGAADAAALADFFKPMIGMLNVRVQEENKNTAEPPLLPQPPLTPDEMATLDKGEPVRRSSPSGRLGSRLMVTPSSRKAVRSLSAELEDRLLALERSIRTTQAPLRYSHRTRSEAARQTSYLIDEMLKDAAAALTRPPTTASASAAAKKARAATAQKTKAARAASEQYSEATGKPVSAPAQPAYADDALAYLNQFILPLPSGRMRTPPTIGADLTNSISTAIPRTYTTGDPTYSVSGVDLSANSNPTDPVQLSKAVQNALPTASQSSLQAVAAAAMALNASSSSTSDLTATANAAAETIRTLGEGRNLAEVRREVLGVAAAISQQAQQAQAHFGHNPLHTHTQAFAQFQQAQNYLGYATAQLQGLSGYAGFNNVGEAEQAMFSCKKECEALEKKLMGLARRNRKAAGLQ